MAAAAAGRLAALSHVASLPVSRLLLLLLLLQYDQPIIIRPSCSVDASPARVDNVLSPASSQGMVAWWRNGRASDLRSRGREFDPRPGRGCVTTLGKLFTPNCLDADTTVYWVPFTVFPRKM